jgi:hypothetical protein
MVLCDNNHGDVDVREVTCLAGHLEKWFRLYGAAPGVNSHIWSWSPDWNLWKQGTLDHDKDAVKNRTERLVNIY